MGRRIHLNMIAQMQGLKATCTRDSKGKVR
jgi:hypothetical protein